MQYWSPHTATYGSRRNSSGPHRAYLDGVEEGALVDDVPLSPEGLGQDQRAPVDPPGDLPQPLLPVVDGVHGGHVG